MKEEKEEHKGGTIEEWNEKKNEEDQ